VFLAYLVDCVRGSRLVWYADYVHSLFASADLCAGDGVGMEVGVCEVVRVAFYDDVAFLEVLSDAFGLAFEASVFDA